MARDGAVGKEMYVLCSMWYVVCGMARGEGRE